MVHDPSIAVVAMHGWAGDARCWRPWIEATAESGWHWECGERGYGEQAPFDPAWPSEQGPDTHLVVIAHSLGLHLVAPDVLRQARSVVLLASFGTFVPPGRAGRRARAALDGMADKLGSEAEAKAMLQNFFTNVATPQSPNLLPTGPMEGRLRLERLRADLEILASCEGLPRDFPHNTDVLVVEAGEDRIVDPMAQSMLREALPQADIIRLEGSGHALLGAPLVPKVVAWVQSTRCRESRNAVQ
jgi:pimeloyl-[acyl-carrier protein] methyl ester esterase